MTSEKIVNLFIDNGFMITPDTLKYLEGLNIKNRENLIRTVIYRAKSLAHKPIVITRKFIMDLTPEQKNIEYRKQIEKQTDSISNDIKINNKQKLRDSLSSRKVSKFHAKDIEPIIELDSDPTGNLVGSGCIEDIHKYFLDRFNSLKSLLKKRRDSKDAITIKAALDSKGTDEKVKIIGMVKEKEESKDKKNNNLFNYFIELEDLDDSIRVFIPGTNDQLVKIASHLVLDQVICVEGVIRSDILIAENIYFPDIPNKKHQNNVNEPVSVVLLSDLHFGSKKFLSENFSRFIDWLYGKIGNEKQKELAFTVKYILISGDLIDGVGVYPGHEKNLSVIDIKGQYELAAEYLSKIPEYISIIIIPGGAHDAVRKALPQEAIPRKYAKELYDLENTIMLGNPSFLRVHGARTIMYHGEGFDDIIPSIPGLSYANCENAMVEFLKSRHLAPIYGKKVGLSPEPYDWLVIRDIPDILHCGHTHITRTLKYKGVSVVNSGTFQAETEYQQSLGIKPTPGIVPIIKLSDFSIRLKRF